MQILNVLLYCSAAIILFFMAKEDWKYMSVPDWLCDIGLFLAIIASMLVSRHPIVISITFLWVFCFLFLPELTFFGDADYIPLALYIAFYAHEGFFNGFNCLPFLIAMIMLLFTLYPTAYLYYKSRHRHYHLFQGMYVPLLPSVAIAWCLTPIPLILSYLGGLNYVV